MGTEDHRVTGWHILELLYEDGALGTQVVYDILVMDNLVPNIDWSSKLGERAFDDFNSAVHSSAESTGLSKNDFHFSAFAGLEHGDDVNLEPEGLSG
jgi:hypothetical protein